MRLKPRPDLPAVEGGSRAGVGRERGNAQDTAGLNYNQSGGGAVLKRPG